jgi:hypothetical protein
MAKRKFVVGFLFILLIVFFNNNVPFELAKAGTSGVPSSFFSSVRAENNHAAHLHSFSKHSIKKEHIKVRYKGSEFSYYKLPLNFVRHEFYLVETRLFPANNAIDLPVDQSVFKLRGPPSVPIDNSTNDLFAA